MIYTNVIVRLCIILFAVHLFINGALFILGPMVFGIDYAVELNTTLIGIYILIFVKLFGSFWVALTLLKIKLIRYQRLSNSVAWSAITCSAIHLIYMFAQHLSRNHINDLLEVMTEDSIKTILLMLLYLLYIRRELKGT